MRHLGFRTLRHTAVSLFIAHEGPNPKQLTTIIGHASIQLTYDTHGHLMPDAFDGFGVALDGLAEAAATGSQNGNRTTVKVEPRPGGAEPRTAETIVTMPNAAL